MNSIFCSACGQPLPESAKFCSRCGAKVEPLPDPPQSVMSTPMREIPVNFSVGTKPWIVGRIVVILVTLIVVLILVAIVNAIFGNP